MAYGRTQPSNQRSIQKDQRQGPAAPWQQNQSTQQGVQNWSQANPSQAYQPPRQPQQGGMQQSWQQPQATIAPYQPPPQQSWQQPQQGRWTSQIVAQPPPWQGPWNQPPQRPPWMQPQPLPRPGPWPQPRPGPPSPWPLPQPQPKPPQHAWHDIFGGEGLATGMVDYAGQHGYTSPIQDAYWNRPMGRPGPIRLGAPQQGAPGPFTMEMPSRPGEQWMPRPGPQAGYMQVSPEMRGPLNSFMAYMHLNKNRGDIKNFRWPTNDGRNVPWQQRGFGGGFPFPGGGGGGFSGPGGGYIDDAPIRLHDMRFRGGGDIDYAGGERNYALQNFNRGPQVPNWMQARTQYM